jgi:hypothetical protein
MLLRDLAIGMGVCTPQFLAILVDVKRDGVQMLRGDQVVVMSR